MIHGSKRISCSKRRRHSKRKKSSGVPEEDTVAVSPFVEEAEWDGIFIFEEDEDNDGYHGGGHGGAACV